MDQELTVTLHTGRAMPILALGTWRLTSDTAGTVAHALAMGYRMIDTSGDYGTQPGIGEGIKQAAAQRESFYLVTKVEETDNAYEATQQNLAELQLEYADLMLIHRPPPQGAGEDLWQGLIRAKQEGLTKDIGVSNYSEVQIQALADSTGEMPVVNQIEWSPFGWSQTMLEFCYKNNIVVQAYSPLTHGRRLSDPVLEGVASKHDKSPAQVLIRWSLQMGTIPLPKANQLHHLEENLAVFDFQLDDEDMQTLAELNEQYSALS